MADILKITTPLVNKNQQVQLKPGVDPTAAFDLQDVTKVAQPRGESEILKQNNGMIQKDGTPTILANLLKDPSVTVTYLKNIFMLEEIIRLLPANNRTVTEEIEQLFHALLVRPEEIAPEMMRQENISTAFKGELFSLLRQVSEENPPQAEVQAGIAEFLKAVNHVLGDKDVLDGVANNLQYLAENLKSSKSLAPRLENLMQRFRQEDAPAHFGELKRETLDLLREVSESVLYSPKAEKTASIAVYNLSRYNGGTERLRDSAAILWRMLSGDARREFPRISREFFEQLRSHGVRGRERSRVMDVLVKLITTQAEKEPMSLGDPGKAEKIIYSLLSSPCNFTPLLHFVVPVLFENARSFAEIWINPHSEEPEETDPAKRAIQILLVIDIETEGRFEAELYVRGKNIDFSLFCPTGLEDKYAGIVHELAGVLAQFSYHLGDVRVEKLERSRSLMEVFKTLPYKRTGVDVKV